MTRKITLLWAFLLATACGWSQAVTYNYTGAMQTYIVPACVTQITVTVNGAAGGTGGETSNNSQDVGGKGGSVVGVLNVVPGTTLNIFVGGAGVNGTPANGGGAGGWNGGGNGGQGYNPPPPWLWFAGGGGGASDIRVGGVALANRVVVGGGGGGAGFNYFACCNYDQGGPGGGLVGQSGWSGNVQGSGGSGTGGTQAAGGIGGAWGGYCACLNGTLGIGSNDCVGGFSQNAGGGGGGGYYGGGAGCWSGGGGGSSYVAGLFSLTSNLQNIQAGNGFITITPLVLGGFTLTTSQTNITCNGQANGTATANPSPVGAYTYLWTPTNQTNQTATGLSAGSYTVTVVNGGCTVTASVTITQPTAINIVNNITNPLCNGGFGSITAVVNGGTPGYNYVWSPIGGTGATVSNLSVGCYTLTVTDANGCVQTASACVTQPTALSTSMVTTLATCGSNNGTATVTVNGGTPGYTYSWAPIGGNGAMASNLPTGSYTVTVTDANGCTITASANISNAGGVIANISLVINEPCFGDNVGEIDITDGGGVPPYTYIWTNGATSQNITGLLAGGYTVTVTDQNGCSAVANATITQPPAVTATLSGITNILCNGSTTGSVIATGGGGTPGYNYLWSNGETSSNATGLSAGGYTVTVTDANGCTGTANVTLTQPTAITLTPAATNAFCGQPDGTATIIAGGGVPGYNYIWNNGATTSAINNLLPGNYCVTVTDANACTATACITVNNTPGETINISGVTDVSCNGQSNGSLQTTIVGGVGPYTFLWSNTSTSQNATGLSAGSYTVTVTDFHGCQATAIGIVTQPAVLVASINGTQTICVSQNAVLNGIVNGGTLPYTYAWSNGGTTSSITVSPATTTTYTLNVTDANGCIAAPVTITVTVSPPITLVMGPPRYMCIGGQANISVIASGGDGNYAYNWMPGNESGQNVNVSPAATTTYTVTVTDNCGSPAVTGTVSVTINPSPVVAFMADSVSGCSPLCATFTNQTTLGSGTMKSYLWNFGGGAHDTTSQVNYDKCFPTPGNYSISLTAISDSGCMSASTNAGMITVYTHPTASFVDGPQPTTIDNPAITFTDKSIDNYGLASWSWNFGDQTDSVAHTPKTIHTYQDTGTYCATLTVTNIHGCADSVTNCLVIGPQFAIYIPSAFTPNGDGINDIFQVKGSYITSFTMYIFNRWGSLIYSTTDINKGWDGALNNSGPLCQEDTYVYLIQATDNKANLYKYTGRVSLLK